MAMSDDTNTFLRSNLIFESALKDSLKCGLCTKIIVDCCMTKCGCDFCRDCILRYFENGGDQINCPTCKSENIGFDIEENKSINMKIKLVRVKCPNQPCTNIDTISNMVSHIKECDNAKMSCSFINLGCNEAEIIGNLGMKVHFGRHIVEHNEILINILTRLETDNNIMKNNLNELTTKNTELENKFNNQEMKINELENKVDEMEVRDVNLRRELKEYKTNSRRCQDKMDEFEISIDDLILNTDEIMDTEDEIKETLWNQIVLNNQFIWRIDELSEKRKEAIEGRVTEIDSDIFCSHAFGYDMKLRIYPNEIDDFEGHYLSIFFVIIEGEFDEILEWPCRKEVKLGLIDQDNLEDKKVRSFHVDTIEVDWKHVFDKPTQSENFPYGFGIKWTKLNNSPHLLKDDVLFIKCVTL